MPERCQSDVSQLEMLLSEGNADDGDAEQHTEEHVREPYPDASHEKPDDIHHAAQTAMRHLPAHTRAKRPQRQQSQLDVLQAERNANDGNHQRYTRNHVFDGYLNATEHQPNDVSQ